MKLKSKFKLALLAVGVLLAVSGVSVGQVHAEGVYLPHNTLTWAGRGNCQVEYYHGNYAGSIYAKYRVIPGYSCAPGTYVRVQGYDGTRYPYSQPCSHYKSGCDIGGGWIQAYLPPTIALIKSELVLCSSMGSCDPPRIYNGI